MEIFFRKGVTIIGAPWSGKTTAGKIAAQQIECELRISKIFHDMDDDGLQGPTGWGKDGVAKKLNELGDEGFLENEGRFILDNYGNTVENKLYNLDRLLFCSTGSLPLSEVAMNYVKARSTIVFLEVPIDVLTNRASPNGRPDGNTRIVGMNGANPRFQTLKETLEYRGGIYRASADIVIPYKDESSQETGSRLADIILNI